MVAVDPRVLRGRQTVSFAYSLSQGHSQQARILPIHHSTRIMCSGPLFPLPKPHGVKEQKSLRGPKVKRGGREKKRWRQIDNENEGRPSQTCHFFSWIRLCVYECVCPHPSTAHTGRRHPHSFHLQSADTHTPVTLTWDQFSS